MGAKTAVLAFVDDDLPTALRAFARSQVTENGLLPGAVLLCDRRLVAESLSDFPQQLLEEAAGR